MKTKRYTTEIIQKHSEIPPGYVPLHEYTQSYGKTGSRELSRAHLRGEIRAVKIKRCSTETKGPVFVHPEDAVDCLNRLLATPPAIRPAKTPPGDVLIVELRRIAEAQEKTVAILERMESLWQTA